MQGPGNEATRHPGMRPGIGQNGPAQWVTMQNIKACLFYKEMLLVFMHACELLYSTIDNGVGLHYL